MLIKFFKIISWVIIFSFSGCVTTRVEYTEPEEIKKDAVYRISIIYTKDGKIYDMLGLKPEMKFNYKDMGNAVIFKSESGEMKIIKISEIAKMKIIVLENDIAMTSWVVIGSLLAAVLIFIILIYPIGTINAVG